MICPRCSVAEVSPETQRCVLCGYAPEGGVAVLGTAVDEVLETVQRELADRFELQALLRRERLSTLYLARDLDSDRLVTLRMVPRPGPVETDLLPRFVQATALAGRLQHPHVVSVLSHGVTQSLIWYAMETVKGRTLAAMLERAGPMEFARCQALLEQVASGLEYLHRHGLFHGALSPSTLLVDGDGWLRVADVGTLYALARAGGPESSWWNLLDPAYVAPEVARGRGVGPAADQYALGMLSLRCLAGPAVPNADDASGPPAEASPRQALEDLLGPGVPPHVPTAIARAVRQDPSERFSNVLDFVAVLGGAGVRASGAAGAIPRSGIPTVVVPEPALEHRPRGRFRLPALLAVVALAAAGLTWAVLHRPAAESGPPRWAEAPAAAAPRPAQVPSDVAAEPAVPDPTPRRPEPAPVRAGPAPVAQTAPAPAAATATLSVNSTPWGAVYLGDRLLGNTPRANVEVPAGTHLLRVVRDGYEAFEQEIRLQPGQSLRLLDIVLAPLRP